MKQLTVAQVLATTSDDKDRAHALADLSTLAHALDAYFRTYPEATMVDVETARPLSFLTGSGEMRGTK